MNEADTSICVCEGSPELIAAAEVPVIFKTVFVVKRYACSTYTVAVETLNCSSVYRIVFNNKDVSVI